MLFPKTWEKHREQMTVGQIVIVEGKVDAGSTPPKISVDSIRTEIKILEPLDSSTPPLSKPTPATPPPVSSQPKPVTPESNPGTVSPINIKSTQSKPIAKQAPTPQTVNQVADEAPAYVAPTKPPLTSQSEREWDDMPPPPDNFPDDWDTQWQPSFEEAVIASKPEPRFKKTDEITPPRAVVAPVMVEAAVEAISAEKIAEEQEQAEAAREALVTSIYIPIQKEEEPNRPPQQITLILRSTGDKERDRREIALPKDRNPK